MTIVMMMMMMVMGDGDGDGDGNGDDDNQMTTMMSMNGDWYKSMGYRNR